MSARSKGASGEREACKWLHRRLYGRDVGLERNLNQVRSGGADVIHHPFVFEIKRRGRSERNLNYNAWWIQVNKAAKACNENEGVDTYTPIVMFRIDAGDWQFLIPATQIGCSQGWLHIDRVRFLQWAKSFAKIV
jgi:hypothetical protein